MTEHPASVIRRASALLKERASALPATPWEDLPWTAPEGTCLVYQGEYKPYDQPQVPPIHYIAGAETPAHAAWIALMDPKLGKLLAAWLDEAAQHVEEYVDHVLPGKGPTPFDCSRCGHWFPDDCDCWNGSLSVARLILGEPDAAAIPGEGPYARTKSQQQNLGGFE